MDVNIAGALSDPYLVFYTDPPELLLNKRTPQTSIIKRELNPK